MFEKQETNDIPFKSLVRKIRFLPRRRTIGSAIRDCDTASGWRRVKTPLGLALLRCSLPIYPQPSQGTALLTNDFSVMGKLVVDNASNCVISLGLDGVRRVTLRTRPGEVFMLRQTHGSAVTFRNEDGSQSTPGRGPE